MRKGFRFLSTLVFVIIALAVGPDRAQAQDPALYRGQEISAIHEGVVRLRDVRSQIQAFVDREEGIAEEGKALIEKLDGIENALIQKRTVDGQTVINFPVQLNHHYIYLHGAVDGSELGVPEGARERLSDMNATWRGCQSELENLLGPELDRFDNLIRERGIAPVSATPPP